MGLENALRVLRERGIYEFFGFLINYVNPDGTKLWEVGSFVVQFRFYLIYRSRGPQYVHQMPDSEHKSIIDATSEDFIAAYNLAKELPGAAYTELLDIARDCPLFRRTVLPQDCIDDLGEETRRRFVDNNLFFRA